MTAPRVAITGAEGQLGRQLITVFEQAGWEVLGAGHDRLDITSAAAMVELSSWQPQVVVNSAAWTDVDGCTRDPARADRVNGDAAGRLARAAAKVQAVIIQMSTNEVFDGEASEPYSEASEPHAINAYGASKLLGEHLVAAANPNHLIVRTAWIFGPGGRNFPSKMLELARRATKTGEPVRVVSDEIGNPTWAFDLAVGVRLAVEAWFERRLASGIIHLAGEPPVSRFDWADAVFAAAGIGRPVAIRAADFPRPGRVPLHAVLSTERATALGIDPSNWRAATAAYAVQLVGARA